MMMNMRNQINTTISQYQTGQKGCRMLNQVGIRGMKRKEVIKSMRIKVRIMMSRKKKTE